MIAHAHEALASRQKIRDHPEGTSKVYTFHALDSKTTLPGKYGMGYRKLAILRVDQSIRPGYVPTRIAAINGVRILYSWRPSKPGKTARSQYARDLAEQAKILEWLHVLQSDVGRVVSDLYQDFGVDPSFDSEFTKHVIRLWAKPSDLQLVRDEIKSRSEG